MAETIAQVLDRVAESPMRAAETLVTELSRPRPRKSLVSKLEALVELPATLDDAGRDFWLSSRALYLFRVDELVLLERACRIIDDLADLDVEKAGLSSRTTRGSQGQLVTHPVVDQMTKAHADLRATIKALNFPDPEAARSRSEQARKAALSRWGG